MSLVAIVFGGFGAALIGLSAFQLSLATYDTLRRSRFNRKAERLAVANLKQRSRAIAAQKPTTEPQVGAWNGYRKFVVVRKELEAEDICSFYLAAHDNKPIADFFPGQFLTFQFNIFGQAKPVVRCYSLSDCYREDYYRISVKRCAPPPNNQDAPPGLVSNFLHDHVERGDIIDVKAPSGQFYMDIHRPKPAVMLGGGIGITPFVSMAAAALEAGSTREIWMFYGARKPREQILSGYLRELSHKHDNFHYVSCCSDPDPQDTEGIDFDHKDRISVELLRQYLKSSNYEFFMCGPAGMMTSMSQGLASWGVPKEDIRSEAFGPASVPKPKKAKVAPTDTEIKVEFSKSKKSVAWDGSCDNLLEFGEEHGAQLQGACRVGNCGTCEVALLAGEVEYNREPEYADLEEGCCLACISTPKGKIVLDA